MSLPAKVDMVTKRTRSFGTLVERSCGVLSVPSHRRNDPMCEQRAQDGGGTAELGSSR